jgi:transposase
VAQPLLDARISERAALTGILFVLRGGLPWQMLPREMGLRFRQHVLATLGGVGTGRRLASLA